MVDILMAGILMAYTFINIIMISDRLTKIIGALHTRDFEVASNTYAFGILVEKHQR